MAVPRPAERITERDIRRRINIIADDSMGGRDTPSRGLELTAAWVAGEFQRFGLRPGGDGGSYLQRYPLNRTRLDLAHTVATFAADGSHATATAARDLIYVSGRRNGAPLTGAVQLIGGTLSPEGLKGVACEGKVVLIVPDFRRPDMTPISVTVRALLERKPVAIVIVSNGDSAGFARQVTNQARDRTRAGASDSAAPGVATVRARAIQHVLAAAGVDLAALRASATIVTRELPTLRVALTLTDVGNGPLTAPNSIGILEGSDPQLKSEYVVFSAHMDHVGVNANAKGDTIWNGADDDASGTVGVVELAEAFSRPGARPKRSLIFLTVSGEEKGLWGSEYFATHPPVPIGQIVADLNMDMIGRNWKDTIVAIGKEHSDLGATLNRVNREHAELGVSAIDDIWPQEGFYFRSDHYNFARRGVPILFFFNGTHRDYHQASDSPDKIDAEKEARIVRLIYFLGRTVANDAERPKWTADSYKRIVEKEFQR